MGEYSEGFVAFDVAKTKHAVALADGGSGGEVRFVGEIDQARIPKSFNLAVQPVSGRSRLVAEMLAAFLWAIGREVAPA